VYTSEDGNFNYGIDDNTEVVITNLTEKGLALTEYTIPATDNNNKVTTIGSYAFRYNTELKKLTLPDTITTIKDKSFAFSALEEINFGKDLKEIGICAFEHCRGLTEINLPDSVSRLRQKAFSYCESLESFKAPASLTDIYMSAFEYCTGLKEFDFNNVTYIDYQAFYNCGFEELTIPGTVKVIGQQAFKDNVLLTSVTLSAGVKEIMPSAFTGCRALEELILPEGLEVIGSYAFGGCGSLATVTIQNGIKVIGIEAFRACDKLVSVVILAAVPPQVLAAPFLPHMPFTIGCTIYVADAAALAAYEAAEGFAAYTIEIRL